MTSTHSGPYKSKLFNFLANQYQKTADKFERALNQVKYTTATTTQIVVYPVYVAVQTIRLSVKRLQQQAEKLLPQANEFVNEEIEESSELEGPPRDRPVRKVLDVAAELVNEGPVADGSRESFRKTGDEEIPAKSRNKYIRARFWEVKMRRAANHRGIKSNSKTAPYTVIVGIACSLDNGNLVLVTTGNKVLDVLSQERQQRLNRRILLEILCYQRDRRLKEQLEQKPQDRELEPCARIAYQEAGPTQLWWQMLAWVETSPVAVKANLFEESALADIRDSYTPPENETASRSSLVIFNPNPRFEELSQNWEEESPAPKLQPLMGLSQSSLLLFLDEAIAALEKGDLVQVLDIQAQSNSKTPASSPQWHSPKSEKLLPKSKVPTESIWQGFLSQYFYPMAPLFGLGGLVPSQEEDLEYLEELGAVKFSSKSSSAGAKATKAQLGKEKQVAVATKSAPKTRKAKANKGQGAEYSAPARSKRTVAAKKKQAPKQPKSRRWELTETVNLWANVSLSLPVSNQPSLKSVSSVNLQVVSGSGDSDNNQDGLEYKPDFLEANSVSVGYVKHPLEQLLEWLDLVMLRLEQSILQVGKWFHHIVFPSRLESDDRDD
ncbi:MAG: hypothetical protein SXA11_06165 [Cyanobacteriota bacterium]|nr:hypothetical protein [Cyanobacteriota bacterium]